MRAIEALHLPAHRDNKNAWKVDADALDAWRASVKPAQSTAPLTEPLTAPPPGPPTHDVQANAHAAQVHELETERAALRVELRGLEVERDQLRERLAAAEALMRERITEAQAERERLLTLVERMAAEAARPWWERLLGRRG